LDLAQSRVKANALEEMWTESERRYHEQCRQELRQSWREYHLAQADRLERVAAHLAQEHRRKAESLHPSVAKLVEGYSGPSVAKLTREDKEAIGSEAERGRDYGEEA
jgi:hypothetical protein